MRAVITGGSSGIGEALGRELARRGWAVALLARRGELVQEIAASLPRAVGVACDVTDSASVHEAVRIAEERLGGPFDLAVANAGVSLPGHAAKFKLEDAERTFRVNVFGMLYLFDAVIPGMVERRAGRFAGIASIAGLRALPTAASYSASKAAMHNFLEASRIELVPYGVGITVVNPGFVDTPIVAKNKFRMPFLLQAPEAARIIADGLERGKRVIEFPRPMSLLMRTVRILPTALYERFTVPYAQKSKR
ncbi:MAG TPA: SDR family NAD(P)-dependent oxidoreductase [Thermoanaerobaculia bacterium]|nr:SDR family NAD(P)-dependent oxidoreductase [Thermoanaerobaculia bacterium]